MYSNCYLHGCPCGYAGDTLRQFTCNQSAIERYQKRISGPLLDRIDIHIQVPRVEHEKLAAKRSGELSEDIRARVAAAREKQTERFAGTKLRTNADMGTRELEEHAALDANGQAILSRATQQLQLSARAYHRILKLARTIADLADAPSVQAPHLAEALQYRARMM